MPVSLWSAVGAAAYLGPLYWQALIQRAREAHPRATFIAVLDCAERPGDVLAALRQGLTELSFSGNAATASKLMEIARQKGARLYLERPHALDLREVANPIEACRLWFCPSVENSPPLG
ncbi:MAG: hypothetical protein HYR63_18050 [Proteobacteria bacterium]|nr:hypothetical protein [Pseudomonadota bacterium]MBI3496528.1 hypothetical protein [Pseudomonadota bacterium]